ncbi:MAG: hypothetical protein ACRDPS_24970 [Nocardioides sp.]|uniref:hypothetical protein n=1 Tax=Nocardioides sp. TaxID=35761 RepID=UPI003D6A5D89
MRKPATWVVGVILVALGATFSSGLQDLFDGLLPDGWNEPGSGIKLVDVRRQPVSGLVLIPDTEAFARFEDMTDARTSVNEPDWQAQHEWYAVDHAVWEVTLVGRHRDPVEITDLRPERTGPCTQTLRRGAIVEDTPQGESEKIQLKTAIDAKVPQLTSGESGSAYFNGGTVELAKGETVVIAIDASTAGQTCEWVLKADYVDHGKRKSMTIKAPGDRPFAITGYAEDHPYELTWSIRCDRPLKPAEMLAGGEPSDCF